MTTSSLHAKVSTNLLAWNHEYLVQITAHETISVIESILWRSGKYMLLKRKKENYPTW